MTASGVLVLAALAGLNPWIVLLLVAGLATYTPHATLAEPFAAARGTPLVVALGVLVGVEVVASKLRRVAAAVDWLNAAAGAATGALLGAALGAGAEAGTWVMAAGAALALAVRLARQALVAPLGRKLAPYGEHGARMLLGIAADVLAGTLAAGVFALKP
jgi:hypothetical protein